MNDIQLTMIYKIIQSGAPALANELCTALDNLVVSYSKLEKQYSELKKTCENTEKGGEK